MDFLAGYSSSEDGEAEKQLQEEKKQEKEKRKQAKKRSLDTPPFVASKVAKLDDDLALPESFLKATATKETHHHNFPVKKSKGLQPRQLSKKTKNVSVIDVAKYDVHVSNKTK